MRASKRTLLPWPLQMPQAAKASSLFQGLANDQTKANVSGRLLEQTLGLQNRALNQVAARSALLGPLMAAAFPLAIIAGVAPLFAKIGEEIINTTNDLGGYTKAVQQVQKETIKASQEAFLNPKTLQFAQQHLNQLNSQIETLNKAAGIETSRGQMISEQVTLEGKVVALLFAGTINSAASASLSAKATALTADRVKLLEKVQELEAEINNAIAQGQERTALIGKSGFSKIAQEHANTLKNIADLGQAGIDPAKAASLRVNADNEANAQIGELHRQMAMETMKLNDQVTENNLSGIAKIKQEEANHLKEILAEDIQKLGLSKGEVEATALYQAQIAGIHQHTQQQILAYSVQTAAEIAAIQDRTRDTFLQGDDLIFAEQSEAVSRARAEYEKAPNPAAWEKYQAEIVLADAEAQKKIRAAHLTTAQQDAADLAARTLEIGKLKDDQINAQSAAALASLPPWKKAYQQIYDAENSALNKIQKDQATLRDKYAGDADVLAQIDSTSQAERVRVWAEADEKIRAENLHLTEQFGSELQSAFDDMTSGNIGKRILANMEKFFFQIVAQWILSMNVMKSTFGQLAGIALFGPGSTGASVLGGGGGGSSTSVLGSIFGGGGSSGSSAPSGAAFQPGGIFSDPSAFAGGSGLSSAIAGTSASTGGGLPSASNALTTATMSDALGNVGGGASAVSGSASKAGGLSSLFSLKSLAALAPLGAMALGAAGGKVGSIGGMIMGLLLTGKLGSLIQPFTLGAGLAGTAAVSALVGAATGGLIGFGVGQQHGGVLGSLAGAGSGALAGLMVGGPIGALVGGIVGLLGGIFGGIFGGSKRKKQANALADNTLLPDITQISTGFDGFQIDSSSAIQQLEQLRTDSQKQLSALQSQGKDVFNQKVNPAIDAAETHIRGTQAERDRRSAQVFGPPQFDTGGMFVMRGGNAGLAVLHDGEAVVNRTGTKKNLNAIAAMNAGKTVGGGFHIAGDFIIKTGSLDPAYVRSGRFRKDLLDAFDQAAKEGAM
ncbi:MAG: hypothetical protein ACJ71W_16625 [Terriglobales bacterium]